MHAVILCQCVLQRLYSHLKIFFSSNAEIYFNNSIKFLACSLFGDLDFTTSDEGSWANVADLCISKVVGFVILRRQIGSGQGHPLAAAQCQYYTFPGDQQPCQCRMDCLLAFHLLSQNSPTNKFGYIHLRNISCSQHLFRTNINHLFNNRDSVQPSFTSRSNGCSVEGAK